MQSTKKLTEHQVKFLFNNAFFLVANALPMLFQGKERGASVINNQAKAMQARVNAECNFIVNRIIKQKIRKHDPNLFGTDSEGDQIQRQILQKSSGKTTPLISKKKEPIISFQDESSYSRKNDVQLRMSEKQFIDFFKESIKFRNLLDVQGLRDAVMPVISSKGSFQMYKAAGAVIQSTSRKKIGTFVSTRGNAVITYPQTKHVRFSEQAPPVRKVFRQSYREQNYPRAQSNQRTDAGFQLEMDDELGMRRAQSGDMLRVVSEGRVRKGSGAKLRMNIAPKIFINEDYH